jgi:hypothetical protein
MFDPKKFANFLTPRVAVEQVVKAPGVKAGVNSVIFVDRQPADIPMDSQARVGTNSNEGRPNAVPGLGEGVTSRHRDKDCRIEDRGAIPGWSDADQV